MRHKGQATFEYFIIFTVVASLTLLSISIFFTKTKQAGEKAFRSAVASIVPEVGPKLSLPEFSGAGSSGGDKWWGEGGQIDFGTMGSSSGGSSTPRAFRLDPNDPFNEE